MFFLNTLRQQKKIFQEQVKVSVNPLMIVSDAKADAQKRAEQKVDFEWGLTKSEFLIRYNRLRLAMMMNIAMLSAALYQIVVAKDLSSFAMSIICFLMGAMFYLRYSFMAWRARRVEKKWESRSDLDSVYLSDYAAEVANSPREALPLKIN